MQQSNLQGPAPKQAQALLLAIHTMASCMARTLQLPAEGLGLSYRQNHLLNCRCPCRCPALSNRFETSETNDKETTSVTTYMLLGKTATQVDDFIAKAYDAYRVMLKGEQKGQKADRCVACITEPLTRCQPCH